MMQYAVDLYMDLRQLCSLVSESAEFASNIQIHLTNFMLVHLYHAAYTSENINWICAAQYKSFSNTIHTNLDCILILQLLCTNTSTTLFQVIISLATSKYPSPSKCLLPPFLQRRLKCWPVSCLSWVICQRFVVPIRATSLSLCRLICKRNNYALMNTSWSHHITRLIMMS